jgi:hypothetical protein
MQILEAQKTAWVVSISFFQMFLVLDFFLAKKCGNSWNDKRVDCESSKLDRWKLMEHHEEVKSPSRKLGDDHQLFVQQPGLRPLVEVIRPKKPKAVCLRQSSKTLSNAICVGNVSKGDITSNKSYRIPHKIHQT